MDYIKIGGFMLLIELEERITTHTTYKQIERVLQTLDEIDSTDLSTKQLQMLGRIIETFIFLKEALDKADPWLVSKTTLQNMSSHVANCLNSLINYKSDRNEQHLNNIFTYLENVLLFFSQVLVTRTPEEIENVRSAVIKFRQSLGQHLSNVEKDVNDTTTALRNNSEKLNELTGAIESQKTRIDSIVSNFQNQFLNAQTQRTSDFNNFIKKGEEDFKGTIESFSTSFEELEKQQQHAFDNLNNGFKKQIDTQQDSFDSLVKNFKMQIQTELEQIKEMNAQAEKILGTMSMKGLAQGYKKIANSESWKAFIWNAISILSLVGVLWLGYEFIIKHEGEMSWTALVSRIVLTGVGITLFTYCAKQATNHRSEERRNRKIELELASLDPYLKDFEPEKQKEVKQSLVDKYFGVELPNTTVHQGKVTAHQQQNAIETLTNNPQLLQALAEKLNQYISK